MSRKFGWCMGENRHAMCRKSYEKYDIVYDKKKKKPVVVWSGVWVHCDCDCHKPKKEKPKRRRRT